MPAARKRAKPKRAASRRIPWIVALVVISAAAAATAIFLLRPASSPPAPRSVSAPAAPKKELANVGQERLVGRWLRPDGGYILEIRSATSDGKLDAGYFNPRQIHVARAEWQSKDGRPTVFIELRDFNYPGSTYTLEFLEAEDRMVGTYFQAVERIYLDVEFVRENGSR